MPEPKIIKGLNDLVEYLKSIGLQTTRQTAKKYINDGLPHWKRKRIYHFYAPTIDLFFKEICSSQIENNEKIPGEDEI